MNCLIVFSSRRYLIFIALICAFLVAYSRIDLDVHYAGDVMGAIVVGILSSLLCNSYLKSRFASNDTKKIKPY